MGPPRPLLSFIFGLFKQTSFQFLQQILVKKCPSTIQCRDSNPRTSEHKSPVDQGSHPQNVVVIITFLVQRFDASWRIMTVLAKPSPCHSWYAMKSYRAAATQTNFLSLIYIAILIVCLLLAYLSLFVSFFTYLLCLLFLCFCLIFIVHLSLRIEHLRFDLFNQSMFLFPHNSSSSKAFFFFLLGYFICLILSQLTSLSLSVAHFMTSISETFYFARRLLRAAPIITSAPPMNKI